MMESNHYTDLKESESISKKVLNQMVWRSLFLQGSFNYNRMQACGWLYSILPGLKSIHRNKHDLAKSMTHNMEFFNTHPFLVTFVMGIVLSLEQKKVDIQTIRSIRVATMSSLTGIGDAIFFFTLIPIASGIGATLALSGNFMGPIIFFIIFNVVHLFLRFSLMHWSYAAGTRAIDKITSHSKHFMHSVSILGVLVIGSLIASYVHVPLSEELMIGGTTVQFILDSIMPKLLPITLTFMLFTLTKKNISVLMNLLILIIIGLVGALIGIF